MTRILVVVACTLLSNCAHISEDDQELARSVRSFVNQQTNEGMFSGVVLIAREGSPILHLATGYADRERSVSNTTRTRFNVASLGKMFTAVTVAQLVAEGKLDYDRPVGAYLPDLMNEAIATRVTPHHLLTHTSGIPDLPDSLFNQPPGELAGYLPFFTTAGLEFDPGTQRSYSNSGFVLAGLIVERVSGEPFEERVRREIFERAKMATATFDPAGSASAYEKVDKNTKEMRRTEKSRHQGGPHGGAYLTATDLMNFFEALRGGKLLAPDAVRTMLTPRHGATALYGFGGLDFANDRLIGHSGGDAGASADAYTYWQSGYAVVVLSNFSPPASHAIALHIRELLEPRFGTK